MNKVTMIKGAAIPLEMDDIDTDIIIPAQYLTSTSQKGFGQWAFARLKNQPDFVLNDKKYRNAPLLLAGKNFGCGSSREHAVWAIQELGIKAIIASSFADIFANNAKKNGLLLIKLPKPSLQLLMKQAQNETLIISIDVNQQQLIADTSSFPFEMDGFFKHCLLNGLDELDYLMSQTSIIESFKQNQINQTLFIKEQT